MPPSSFDQFLTLKGLFLKDLLLKLENAGLLVPELKAFFDDSIAKTHHKTEKEKREKKPPNQTQCRVGACYRLLVQRAPDVSPKVRLGAASKMARFLKQRGCVVLDDRTDVRLVDDAVSSAIDLPSSSSASDNAPIVPKDEKSSVQKPKANKHRTKRNYDEKETLKRLEEIERMAKARAEQESSDEEESCDEDDEHDDSCPPEEALELVPESDLDSESEEDD